MQQGLTTWAEERRRQERLVRKLRRVSQEWAMDEFGAEARVWDHNTTDSFIVMLDFDEEVKQYITVATTTFLEPKSAQGNSAMAPMSAEEKDKDPYA